MITTILWTTAILFDKQELRQLHRPCCGTSTTTVDFFEYNYTCAEVHEAYTAECCNQNCTVSLPAWPPSIDFLRAQYDKPVVVLEEAVPWGIFVSTPPVPGKIYASNAEFYSDFPTFPSSQNFPLFTEGYRPSALSEVEHDEWTQYFLESTIHDIESKTKMGAVRSLTERTNIADDFVVLEGLLSMEGQPFELTDEGGFVGSNVDGFGVSALTKHAYEDYIFSFGLTYSETTANSGISVHGRISPLEDSFRYLSSDYVASGRPLDIGVACDIALSNPLTGKSNEQQFSVLANVNFMKRFNSTEVSDEYILARHEYQFYVKGGELGVRIDGEIVKYTNTLSGDVVTIQPIAGTKGHIGVAPTTTATFDSVVVEPLTEEAWQAFREESGPSFKDPSWIPKTYMWTTQGAAKYQTTAGSPVYAFQTQGLDITTLDNAFDITQMVHFSSTNVFIADFSLGKIIDVPLVADEISSLEYAEAIYNVAAWVYLQVFRTLVQQFGVNGPTVTQAGLAHLEELGYPIDVRDNIVAGDPMIIVDAVDRTTFQGYGWIS